MQRLSLLLARSNRGDSDASRQFIAELYSWLQGYYRRRLPPGASDDAVQEAVIAIYRRRHTYDSDRPISAWLNTIAAYKWIDQLRTMRRTAAGPLDENTAGHDAEPAIVSSVSLETLLGMLGPAQSDVIRLVKISGLSIAEASAATGQSPSLVKVNIHRGLERLKGLVATPLH